MSPSSRATPHSFVRHTADIKPRLAVVRPNSSHSSRKMICLNASIIYVCNLHVPIVIEVWPKRTSGVAWAVGASGGCAKFMPLATPQYRPPSIHDRLLERAVSFSCVITAGDERKPKAKFPICMRSDIEVRAIQSG